VIVDEVHPDLAEAHTSFRVLRARSFATSFSHLLAGHATKLKPEIVWNVEQGLALTMAEVVRAEHQRAAMMNRTLRFFESYDLLLCPATIVAPFPVGERYVKACNGVTFETYFDWLAIAYAITLVCAPALSLPCGTTSAGLPVGLQIVAAPNADARVVAGARFLEEILGLDSGRVHDPRRSTSAGPRPLAFPAT
jgi:amidase